jgi:histidine triad (HIT) family protein
MSECLFCKIIGGKIPAKMVMENAYAAAFRDINPQASTHILVIPKKHIESLNDISGEDSNTIGAIHLMIRDLAESEGIKDSGYRVVVNCGKDAGQAVNHLHYHLIGGRKLGWPPG